MASRNRNRQSNRQSNWQIVYGGRALTLALVLTLLLLLGGVRPVLIAWLAGVSLAALAFYGYDKWAAQRGRFRIPEDVLLGLALVGGTLGALAGMLLFRHKTRKGSFMGAFAAILVVQVAALAIWRLYLAG